MNNNIKKQNIKQEQILDKFTEKKRKNKKFTSFIAPLTTKKNRERILECGSFVMLLADLNLENLKLHKANFCCNRFCPMCSWRISCKDSLEITILMEHLRKEENKEFIFLTLTTPNVPGDNLEESIKDYNKSFQRLMQLKEVKKVVKGYIRKLEVTYQKEKYITKDLWKQKKDYYKKRGLKVGDLEPTFDTYNPHFHVIIAVNKTYFKKSDLYITQERWLELWKQSTRDELINQVDVRKSKANNYKEVYELAKYSAKDTDYLVNRQVFEIFYKALKGKQFIVFSGLFKNAHKMFENGELDIYKEKDEIQYVYMLYYDWHKTQYELFKKIELTDKEFNEFNGKNIEEFDLE